MTLALLSKQPAGHSYLSDRRKEETSVSLHTECKRFCYLVSWYWDSSDAYLLQVVPLHWSRNLTSQETIWAKNKQKCQISFNNSKASKIGFMHF